MHSLVTRFLLPFVALACAGGAFAQAPAFPVKPIRLIVPYAPGGIADLLSRVVGQRLGPMTGQQVVVENRPGSGGHVGGELAAKAPPDGYTIVLGTIAHNCAYAMYSALPYSPGRDLQPVVLLAESQGVLVVHPSLPTKTVREFVALAKARPGELNYGSAGAESALHMSAELFKHVAGVNLTHIAYKGSAPAMTDLVGGQIQAVFENVSTALPFVRGGRVRALGVTGPQRMTSLPDVPTIIEGGVKGYEAVPYYTISTGARVPPDVVRKLAADIDAIIRLPELGPRWSELGITPLGGTPEAAQKRNAVETAKWSVVIKAAGIRAD